MTENDTMGRPALLLASVLAFTATGAHAQGAAERQGLDFGLRGGAGYTDNVGRAGDGGVESAFYSLGGTLSYARQAGRVLADVRADLDWLDYEKEGIDSRVWGDLNGQVRYVIVPDRFLWVFADDFGQGAIDPFASTSPNNVENINHFRTGPQLTIRLGSAAGATLDARYGNVWYEDSPNGSDRYNAGLRLFREQSNASRIYLRGSYEDVQFEDDAFLEDYDRVEAALGYEVAGARTTLTAEAGYTEVNRGDSRFDAPLVRLELERRLGDAFVLKLRGGSEFNDSATNLRAVAQFDPRGGRVGVVATGDVFETRYGGATLAFRRQRTGLQAGVDYYDEDYLSLDAYDRKRLRVHVGFDRELTRSLSLRLGAHRQESESDQDGGLDYEEYEYGAGLTLRPTRKLALGLNYQYYRRPGDSYASFDENRAWLRVQWSPSAMLATL